MIHTNGRGFPSDKRLTRPVVEHPDSVTHWTCPDAPSEGETHLIERHLMTGMERCRYCKRSRTALQNEQTAILVNASNARESEFFRTHPREDARPDPDDLVPDKMVARFKAGWHEADARGEVGGRVRAGLMAALGGEVSETDRAELAEAVTAARKDELIKAVIAARRAADDDSNDKEIELLQDALDQALGLLGLAVPEDNERGQ